MKHVHKIKRSKKNTSMDRLAFLAGIMLPVMTIPQAYKVWTDADVQGVSLLTWSLYTVVSLLFVIFGLRHKELLLIYTYTPMFAIEVIIVVGLLFRM